MGKILLLPLVLVTITSSPSSQEPTSSATQERPEVTTQSAAEGAIATKKGHPSVDNLSYTSLKITVFFDDYPLGIGTAFPYEVDGTTYLVTNWHSVSGRDPRTGRPLRSHNRFPNRLEVLLPHQDDQGDGTYFLGWTTSVIGLYDEDGNPVWWEHPRHGPLVDVAVLEVDRTFLSSSAISVNAESLNPSQLRLYPLMEAFVLGFPRGMTGGEKFPVWKRASLASEPELDVGRLPMMYIDTATREGMSGSPVFVHESGVWRPEGESREKLRVGRGHKFIGVYSGRVGDTEFEAQLGVVWKEEAILEIIDGRRRGQRRDVPVQQ